MDKKLFSIIFIFGFALFFIYLNVYALNTQIDPSFKLTSEPGFSNCSFQYNGEIRGNRCIFCPSERYELAKDGTGKDICRLKFISPPCIGQFSQPEKDQLGRDICVARTELTTGTLDIETIGFTPSVNIPCVEIAGGKCPDPAEGIAQYIARIYQFGLMVVGLLALAGLTLGAVKYVLSAGNIVTQEDARDQIKAAIFGILILLGAYLILRTINPDLVTLENPSILKLDRIPDTTGGTPARPNTLTPTQAPPSAPAIRTQTGCIRPETRTITIDGQLYYACQQCAAPYIQSGDRCNPR